MRFTLIIFARCAVGRILLIGLLMMTTASAYPPSTEAEQERMASAIAWCEVVRIDLLEKPRIELGVSSQMRRYTLRVTEPIKGDAAVGTTFSLEFAHYEVLSAEQLRNSVPDVLVWEIHRRPELKVGMEYRVYLGRTPHGYAPLEGRWSMITSRLDKNIYEKWVGRKESPSN